MIETPDVERPRSQNISTWWLVPCAVIIALASVGLFVFSQVKLAGTFRNMSKAAASCGRCCAGWQPLDMPPEAVAALRQAVSDSPPGASSEPGGSK